MPILSGDVKLLESAVMADVPEGGYAPTGNVIADGVSNAIFPDISELDRAGGRVNMRKTFVSIQTDDRDLYFGGNVIVAEPPQDPRVSVTLFAANNFFDRRTDAASRVESYLIKGPEWSGYLYNNHIVGMRQIVLFQRTVASLPELGQTLVLTQGANTQFVRVTKVAAETQPFYDAATQRDYDASVVYCDISDALRFDFTGSPPNRNFTRASNTAVVSDTLVADAGTYAGVVPTTQPAAIGDLSIRASGVYTQLVPSAQTEIPIIDANAAGRYLSPLLSSTGNTVFTTGITIGPNTSLFLGNPCTPGTLTIGYTGGTLTESGGQIFNGAAVVGTLNFADGRVTFANEAPNLTGTKTVTFRPAGAPSVVSDSDSIYVSEQNRNYNYIKTLNPIPAPGTLQVSYMVQNRWYTLYDDGSGTLKGADSSFGAGTVNFITGTMAVTLGALPDVGSVILMNFSSPMSYFNRSNFVVPPPRNVFQLTNGGVVRGSVTITWNDGTARTATDNGTGGFTGAGSGSIDYATGLIKFTPNALPAGGQQYSVAYTYGVLDALTITNSESVSVGSSPNHRSFVVPTFPVAPNTVSISWRVYWLNSSSIYFSKSYSARDDGTGGLVRQDGVLVGTVDYETGVVDWDPRTTETIIVPIFTKSAWYKFSGSKLVGYVEQPTVSHFVVNTTHPLQAWSHNGSNITSQDFTGGPMVIDVTPGYAESIVAGSIRFSLGTTPYFDRNGQLFYNLDPATGSATQCGSINYESGEVTITAWVPGVSSTVSLQSLLTSLDEKDITQVSFRVPTAPVRSGSFQMVATLRDGTNINVTADANGLINSPNTQGEIDVQTGVVNVRFGSMVTAAGNEDEDWYDPTLVEGGMIFQPKLVMGSTIRFNAVAFTYLPLDANILGLDPVRLPSDGRVPIFRVGAFAVVGHTDEITGTVTNSQVVNCGRVRLSRVRVIGNNGTVINTGYTADLEAGTVTFTNVTGYSQPVTVQHRIEDMVLVSDVQINGTLAFTRPLTHNYPTGSYVSSALVAGDMFSRVPLVFDQSTWNGTYSDTPGTTATATFNNTSYPITVTNRGAITEKWVAQFTNSTSYNIIGENVGVIATGNTSTNCAPINPNTGAPYFTIPALGWGAGWATGNVLRFNTIGSMFPVWVVRTVQQGPETVPDDRFTLLIRGDVDTP
jgi:hypothetical protein